VNEIALVLSCASFLVGIVGALLALYRGVEVRRIDEARDALAKKVEEQSATLARLSERVRGTELDAARADERYKAVVDGLLEVSQKSDALMGTVNGIARKVGSVGEMPAVRPRQPSRPGP
jgi:hypothetical protein